MPPCQGGCHGFESRLLLHGEVTERLRSPPGKRVRRNSSAGSNPVLSAMFRKGKTMEKYNIQSLSKFLEQERTVNELCEWFDNMADDYDAHKKEVGFSEDEMYKLLDFWLKIQAIYGNQIFNILSSH